MTALPLIDGQDKRTLRLFKGIFALFDAGAGKVCLVLFGESDRMHGSSNRVGNFLLPDTALRCTHSTGRRPLAPSREKPFPGVHFTSRLAAFTGLRGQPCSPPNTCAEYSRDPASARVPRGSGSRCARLAPQGDHARAMRQPALRP